MKQKRPETPTSDHSPNAETKPSVGNQPMPRLPHERDESASSQRGPDQEVVRQAARDIENGLEDTDTGPVLEDTHRRAFRGDGTDPED